MLYILYRRYGSINKQLSPWYDASNSSAKGQQPKKNLYDIYQPTQKAPKSLPTDTINEF